VYVAAEPELIARPLFFLFLCALNVLAAHMLKSRSTCTISSPATLVSLWMV